MLSSTASTALAIVFSVLLVVNLAGNSLVWYVVLGHRSMRTPMNYLLINLALADMFVGTFFAPQYIFRRAFHHPDGKTGDYLCKFLTGGFLTWVGGEASAFTLVSIAFERYYAIVHSRFQRRQITKKKVKGLIIGCWVYALTVELAPVFVMRYNSTSDSCYEDWSVIIYPRIYTMITFFLDFALPSLIMAYLHGQTIRVLRIETKNLSRVGNAMQFASLKAKKRIIIMVVVVTVIYSVCWLPDVTSYLLAYYVTGFKYGSLFYHTSTVFVCFNSCVNPLVYSIQNKRFRRHLKRLLVFRGSNRVWDVSQSTLVSSSINHKQSEQNEINSDNEQK